jgi:ABC-type Na+ efflux pump permease subunit
MQPLMIILIVPLLALMPVTQDPNGTVARVLSFIPPFTPFVMMNRAAGPPQAWEYAATLALLVASIFVAFYLAAKIFRVGVLMTGTPPRPMQVLRMLRAPVGTVAAKKP